jgi:hypothetical protein
MLARSIRRTALVGLLGALAVATVGPVRAAEPTVARAAALVESWTRHFDAMPFAVAVDAGGNVLVAGFGRSARHPGMDSADAFVRKYGPDGALRWTRRFGSSAGDGARAVAVDARGAVYVVGTSEAALPGQTHIDALDAWIRKYSARGVLRWTQQFGTRRGDVAFGLAADAAGAVYVAGWLGGEYTFLRRYGSGGALRWDRRFRPPGYGATAGVVVGPAGSVALAGGDSDVFVRTFDLGGSPGWTRRFGSSGEDGASGIAIDAAGGVYVTGSTEGTLPGETSAGGQDAYVRAYRADGTPAWTHQFGSAGWDYAPGVAVGVHAQVWVAGQTGGALPGQASAGDYDAYLRLYDPDGSERWTMQFGTSGSDAAIDLRVDAGGAIVVGMLGERGFVRRYTWASADRPTTG